MFEFCLIDDMDKVENIAIRCINCKKETGLYLVTSTLEVIITKFLSNIILHHVVISWIICPNNEMYYEIEENNHPNWFNTGPFYNTAICSNCMENCLKILLNM